MDTGVPVIFCVLTCDTLEQAIDRAGLKNGNKGYDAGLAALEMAHISRRLQSDPAVIEPPVKEIL
jgi:6,7-dimethyl-8-ribityllumazine synthase